MAASASIIASAASARCAAAMPPTEARPTRHLSAWRLFLAAEANEDARQGFSAGA